MRNYLLEFGLSQEEIDRRINECFNAIFVDESEKFYFEIQDDMAYMMDTGNIDARTEGMSYGMMMAVQFDRKDIFNKLWKFSKTYMWQEKGVNQGYFAWSVQTNGTKNSEGPAPDGEEYYAMALFFAAKKWGDGQGIYNYSEQGRDILKHCVHQHEIVEGGHPMWNPENHLIKFVPNLEVSDPSYHLPHFYELFAKCANEEDREFWKIAAQKSREYFVTCANKETGMMSEYAEYDGTPRIIHHPGEFYADAYRVAMNIGLDSLWFGKREEYAVIIDNLQKFFATKVKDDNYTSYKLDGTVIDINAMHPVALIVTTAAGSLATDGEYTKYSIEKMLNTPVRKGDRRYYDNCLYMFCLLMLGGRYENLLA